jgi:hypothetical protein
MCAYARQSSGVSWGSGDTQRVLGQYVWISIHCQIYVIDALDPVQSVPHTMRGCSRVVLLVAGVTRHYPKHTISQYLFAEAFDYACRIRAYQAAVIAHLDSNLRS